jgi:hypothetical protein
MFLRAQWTFSRCQDLTKKKNGYQTVTPDMLRFAQASADLPNIYRDDDKAPGMGCQTPLRQIFPDRI